LTAVVDASAIGPYLLADEEQHLLPGLAHALTEAGVIVPSHWHVEVANLLLVAARRGRLDEVGRAQAEQTVSSAIINVDLGTANAALRRSWNLAEAHNLTIYDACYLELADRAGLPLATNDRALVRAASAENVRLFGR
jgi:predicted nucleic acid-binding protein